MTGDPEFVNRDESLYPPSSHIAPHDLDRSIVDRYGRLLKEEAILNRTVAQATAKVERLRYRIVQAGYDNDAIAGKNQAERDRQEALYLEGDEALAQALDSLEVLEDHLSFTVAERKAEETYLSLQRAYWYAQGGRL